MKSLYFALLLIIAIIAENWTTLWRTFTFILNSKEFTLGSILAVVASTIMVLGKFNKEKDRQMKAIHMEQTQQRMERNQKKIMDHFGIEGEWSSNLQLNGSKITTNRAYKRLFSLLQADTKHPNQRRKDKMKAYLKKLGKTKFQAFLVITLTNIIMLIGSITGYVNIEGTVNEWMPAINLVVQLIATMVYTMVEGAIDKASIKATGQEYTTGQTPASPISTDDQNYSH